MGNFVVRKVAVLGAGVMGAQIAAQLANAQVDVVLFDGIAEGRKSWRDFGRGRLGVEPVAGEGDDKRGGHKARERGGL